MQVTAAEFPSGKLPVDGYGPGFFRVGGQVYKGGIVISGSRVASWSGIEDHQALLTLAGEIDVLFVGMGADIAPLSPDLLRRLDDAGIMAEPMSSPSAARSYNVLLAEGRRVGCALIAV